MRPCLVLLLLLGVPLLLPTAAADVLDEDSMACAGSRHHRHLSADDMRTASTVAERIAACNRLLRADPRQPEILFLRSEAYSQAGRHDDAIADVDRALRIKREDRLLSMSDLNARGDALRSAGQWRSLLEHADQMIADFPGDDAPRLYRGLALARLGREREGMEDLQLWHMAAPGVDDVEAMRLLRGLESRFGVTQSDPARAVSLCQDEALSPRLREAACNRLHLRASGNPESYVYFHRGRARRALEDREGAIKDFHQAARMVPKSRGAYWNLTALYIQTGRPADALEQAKKAVANGPEDTESLFWLARAYESAGRYREAEAEFAALAKRFPEGSRDNLIVLEALEGVREAMRER